GRPEYERQVPRRRWKRPPGPYQVASTCGIVQYSALSPSRSLSSPSQRCAQKPVVAPARFREHISPLSEGDECDCRSFHRTRRVGDCSMETETDATDSRGQHESRPPGSRL